MHKQHTLKTVFLALASAAALAACGDSPPSGAVEPTAGNTVPASATASTSAWLSYAASLPASDRATPLDVNSVTPPTSETEEPRPL